MKLPNLLKLKKADSKAPGVSGAPKNSSKLNKRVIFQTVGILLALVFGYSFISNHVTCVGGMPVLKKQKKAVPDGPLEQAPPTVKVYKVAHVNFRDTVPALGSIKGFREYDLKFLVPGSVEYINFREGEKITQGDIIASLDQKEALLKLEYSKLEFEKNKKLFELGSIIESKYKQSQLEYQSAKAELDKTNIIAFSDGYIGSITLEKGANVSPQDKIATFVDYKDIFVEVGIIEKEVPKIKEGQNVELSLDAYPDELFKGQVDSISPVVENRSRTMKVRAKIANPDEKVKPGMFGRVAILVYEKEDALVIPSSAFKKKEDKYFVYLVHTEEAESNSLPEEGTLEGPDPSGLPAAAAPPAAGEETKSSFGTIEIRNIEVAYATPDSIEVKEGLEEGEMVVVDAEQDLQDKQKVEITETQEGIF